MKRFAVQFPSILRVLGILLMVFSTTMLMPALVGLLYGDGAVWPFLFAFFGLFWLGLITWWPLRLASRDLRLRDGFLLVVLFWTVLGLGGAVPLLLAEQPDMKLVDAVFESVSGLTATGATVLVGLDELPHSILFYRQQLQWLGGMGIVVLAVAILPVLGVGGMQLFRAEVPGPIKDSKLTPRIAETAKALWFIYLGLTASCAVAYKLAGMNWFDAIGHSFSTVAIGGFSTHDASFGYFHSAAIEMVAVFFMLASGINFALHFLAWRRLDLATYWRDDEFRTYALWFLGLFLVVWGYLLLAHTYGTAGSAFSAALFHVVSLGTTTGFSTADYTVWPGFLPILLILASFIGGCTGSTAGGIKVMRFLLLFRQGVRELYRLIHPNAELVVKVGGHALPDNVLNAVWGFFSAYVGIFVLLFLFLSALGMDTVSAFAAVAACMNNMGLGLGEVAANFASVSDPGKWVLCLAMLLGRLEIFTLLVLFTPAFWRR